MHADIPATSILVGRDRELGVLRQHRDAALARQGSLVLIGGEAGIGKTTLAETICSRAAEQGALVLVGRSFDRTETPAYGPWLYLFERYQPAHPLPAHPAAFAEPGVVGAVPSQAALFRQVRDFLSTVTASRPAILLLDDLQWADPASLDLVRHIAQSVATLPLLILVTYRSDELARHHPLATLLPLLVREAHAERIDLHPFDMTDVQTIVSLRYALPAAPMSRLVAYLHARTEGNPFFLGELLRTLEEERVLRADDGGAWRLGDLIQVRVPPLLRHVIDGRIARLDEDSQRLLTVAAVIGHEVPLAVWAAVGEVDEDAVLTVVERALDARLLVETPDGQRVRFAHALVREALYEGIPSIRRRRVHRRIGEVFAASAHPDPDAAAFHFQQAGDERALPWLLEAGERAEAAYAVVTAAARYEAALALMERHGADAAARGRLLARASRLLGFADVPKARALAGEAVALGEAMGDGALVALARFRGGQIACMSGDVASGSAEMEAGAAALARLTESERAGAEAHTVAGGDSTPLLDYRGTVVLWRTNVGRFREARDLGERLLAEAAGDDGALLVLREALYGLGMAYAALGMPDEGAAMLTRAHEGYLRVGNHAMAHTLSRYELLMVALPYRTDDIAGRRRLAERVDEERTRATGAFPTGFPPHAALLPLLVLEGEWDEAERVAAAMGTMEQASLIVRSSAHRHLATLAHLRGEAGRSWRSVRALLPAGSATEPGTVAHFEYVQPTQRVAAALALDAGDLPSARGWLEAQGHWLDWSGAVLGRSEEATQWAQYYRRAGDGEKARDHAERALAHASEPRQPLALLAAHRLLGALDTEAGRYEDAAQHLDASLALATACEAPYERALTLLAMADLRAARGETDAARTLLDHVRAICAPLGAQPTLERADALAARLAAIKDVPPAYPAGLSAREVEVLRLVADGLTNAQVAERLFLSPRTINAHLTTIYTKLNVPSRATAIRFAFDHGLR